MMTNLPISFHGLQWNQSYERLLVESRTYTTTQIKEVFKK